jgi:hypothetical protein
MIFTLLLLLQVSFEHSSSLLIGGDYRSGVTDDSLLYVADGRGVSVFERKTFKRRGDMMLPGRTSLIARHESNIFVGGSRGLVKVNTDRLIHGMQTSPNEKNFEWLHTEPITALQIVGGALWFADASGRLECRDLGQGGDCFILPEPIQLSAPPVKIIGDGTRLYLASDTAGLSVLDLDAEEPKANKLSIEGDPVVMDVLVGEENIYLACAEQGLWVTKPKRSSLKVVDRIEARGEIMSLELFDERIAAAAGTGDFILFSIQNPDEAREIQREQWPGMGLDLAKANEDCFIFTGNGIGHMDLSTKPLAGHGLFFRRAGLSYDILARGEVAVLAAGEAGVRTVSLQDSLAFLGELSQMPDCRRVYLFGSQVYALITTNQIQVVEIKIPEKPARGTFLQFESSTSGLDSEGEMLLAAEHERGVGVWWRCPCGPFKEQGRWGFGGQALDVKIRDKLAFVSTDQPALYVIDWSDSTDPDEVTSLALERDYERLYTHDDLLFGLDSSGALVIINVSRPTRPKELAVLELEGPLTALARHNDLLFIAAQDEGVHVVDISEPASPQRLSTLDVGPALGVAVADDLLLISALYSIEAYKIQP